MCEAYGGAAAQSAQLLDGAATRLEAAATGLGQSASLLAPAAAALAPELAALAREVALLAARADGDGQALVLDEVARLGAGVDRLEALLRLVQPEGRTDRPARPARRST